MHFEFLPCKSAGARSSPKLRLLASHRDGHRDGWRSPRPVRSLQLCVIGTRERGEPPALQQVRTASDTGYDRRLRRCSAAEASAFGAPASAAPRSARERKG